MLATVSSPCRYAAAMRASCRRYEPISAHAASTSSATNTAVGLRPSGNCAGPGSCPCARDSDSNASFRLGRIGECDESQAVAPGAFGCRGATTGDHDARTSRRRRRRRDMDAPPVDVDRVAGEQSQEQLQALVGDLAAPAGIDSHVLVFLWAVADSEDIVDSALAEIVENGHVLSEPDRVIQRQYRRGHQDIEQTGPGGDGRSQHQGRRQVSVGGGVMLAEHRHDGASGLRPCTHLQRGVVQRRCGSARRRSAHIEAHREHGRLRQALGTGSNSTCRAVQTPHDERRVVGVAAVLGRPVHRLVDPDVGHPVQDPVHRDPRLRTRQRRAGARVRARARTRRARARCGGRAGTRAGPRTSADHGCWHREAT